MANRPKPNAVINLDHLERSYIAGFFDGEGTIGIRARKRTFKSTREYWECNVAVCNTDEDIMRWLHSKIGGYLSRHQHKNNRCRPNWLLKLRAHEARTVLPMILPYLRIKKLQAEVVMNFLFEQKAHHAPGVKGHPENVIAMRRDLYNVAKVMNQKGVLNGTTQS